MEILQDKRKRSFTPIAALPVLADGAGLVDREKKSPIICLSIVVARDPESQRPKPGSIAPERTATTDDVGQ